MIGKVWGRALGKFLALSCKYLEQLLFFKEDDAVLEGFRLQELFSMIYVGLSIYCSDLKRVKGLVTVAIPYMTVRDCNRELWLCFGPPLKVWNICQQGSIASALFFRSPSAVFVRTVVKERKRKKERKLILSLAYARARSYFLTFTHTFTEVRVLGIVVTVSVHCPCWCRRNLRLSLFFFCFFFCLPMFLPRGSIA